MKKRYKKKSLTNFGEKNKKIKIVVLLKNENSTDIYSPSVDLFNYLYFGSSFAILQQVQPLSQSCSERLPLPVFLVKTIWPLQEVN